MKPFKDLLDGTRFFVCGGFNLQKVQETPDYNALLLNDDGSSSEIWVTLPEDEPTYDSVGELRETFPNADCEELVWVGA